MEGKMNCEECKDIITISVFGDLTHEAQNQLKAHLRNCSGCAKIYERSEKLSDLNNQKDNIPLPDKEKSWRIISANALKKKRSWVERFALQKPVFQYSAVLLLLIVGFAFGYFLRADGLTGSQLAQLQEEIGQIREITAASLLQQESLNMKLRDIGLSTTFAQSDEIPMEYLFRTLIGDSKVNSVRPQTEQTSPLVDIALTLVRYINQSDVY
jgi:hypothetical protein